METKDVLKKIREENNDKKAKVENFITKFARYYTPAVVIAALVLGVVPPLFLGIGSWEIWKEWLKPVLRGNRCMCHSGMFVIKFLDAVNAYPVAPCACHYR